MIFDLVETIIIGVDISSPVHVDNRKKDTLILGESPTQGLDDTKEKYSTNFTENNKKFCLSLHYNGSNSYLFVNDTEIIKFDAKDSEIVATPSCSENILKDFSVDNKKKTGLNGYVYDFSVDYDAIAVDDILNIHKHLMKQKEYKMLRFIKKYFFTAMLFGCNLLSVNPLKCVSMNNQECRVRPEIINVNGNEPSFYPYSIEINQCSGSCNNTNDPYVFLMLLKK